MRRFSVVAATLVAAAGLPSAPLAAQTRDTTRADTSARKAPVTLDRIVVTAAKREQRLADVVATTEVVTREEIERTGASDLAGALSAGAGIELAGGHPAGAGVMLQGLGSERVLVLLDGQPLPGRISGEFDASRIPASVIERVEIVKGPQSTLYGTDAMGGVVNVITRGARRGRPFVSAGAIAGSTGRMDAHAATGGTLGDVSMRFEGGRRYIEAAPGRQDERGALAERLDGAATIAWRPAALTTIETRVLALDERQRWFGSGLYTFADNLQLTGRVSAQAGVKSALVRATVYGSMYDHLSRASSQPLPIRGDAGSRQVQRLFQGEVSASLPFGVHVADVGFLTRVDDTDSERIPGGRRSLTTLEPSGQLELAVADRLGVTTGARLSRSERWGTHFTPRVAARWNASQALTVRASLGTGFRAPDFRELYMRFTNQQVGYAVLGNETLRPEHSRNAMLGADWNAGASFVRGQLYWNEFRDFIEARAVSAPDEPPVFEYGNIDDGYTRGAELEAGAELAGLNAEVGYGYLETLDRSTRQPLLGRPTHSARATLMHPLPARVRASAAVVYTGRTPMDRDANGSVVSWRGAYPRLDVRLARPLPGDAEIALSVDNVLDRRPANWAGFTGRQFFAALRFH